MARGTSGTPPAVGSTQNARMVDVQTALTGYQPTAATRKSYYSFGGATNTSTSFTSTKGTAERTRLQLTVQPTRFRVHVRNYSGKGDFAPAGSVTVTGTFIGPQSTDVTKPWDYASTPQAVGGSGTAITGLTEFVSGWQVPSYDMVSNKSLLSIGFTYTSGAEIAYGNGSHSITIDDASLAGTTTPVGAATLGSAASATAWYDYNYTILETWIEYEFQDDSARIGLAIGHSMVDGTQFNGGTTPGWDGQMTAWPQVMARRNKHTMTVNAFAVSATTDWNSPTSTKWTSRFTDLVPDYVILQITENDIQNTTATAAAIDTNLRTIIGIIATRYPKAAIYVGTTMPIKPMTNDATKDATRDQVTANITALTAGGLIRGIIDFATPVASTRTVTTATGTGTPAAATYTTTVYQDTWKASLLGADSQHANSAGHGKLAEAADMAGSAVLAISPPRGPMAFTPAIGGYLYPQDVASVSGGAYVSTGQVTLSPLALGPQPVTVDAVAFNVAVAYSSTATTISVGIYPAGPDGLPNLTAGPLAQGAMSLNAATTGTKVITFGAPVTLQPGLYWLGSILTGTTATAGTISAMTTWSFSLPSTSFNASPSRSLTASSAALPTTAIALTAGTSVAPFFGLRRSA